MNITKITDVKTVRNQPIDHKDVSEYKYLHIMIVLAKLADVIERVQKGEGKGSISRETILAEYVAGIQSILILGEDLGFETEWLDDYSHLKVSGELSNHLMQVLEAVVLFRVKKSAVLYKALLMQYLQLGNMLGFELEEIAESFE